MLHAMDELDLYVYASFLLIYVELCCMFIIPVFFVNIGNHLQSYISIFHLAPSPSVITGKCKKYSSWPHHFLAQNLFSVNILCNVSAPYLLSVLV